MKIARRTSIFIFVGLLTFFLGVWLTRLGTYRSYCPRPSAWQILLTFENQDLQALDEHSKRAVKLAIQAHLGKPYEDIAVGFQPALFRSMLNTKGEKRYVFVEEAPMVIVPGNTTLRVHVFDLTGRLLNAQEFNAGYRQLVKSMQVRENVFLETHGLVVNTGYVFTQHESHSFYVLIDNELTLVYLELDGSFYPNNYQSPHMTVGPISPRSVDEWEKALTSGDNAEMLSALVWFGGRHWEDEPPPYDQDKLESEKLLLLRSREVVRNRIEELSKSENLWIKTAAQSVLENNK
jgi:hypothetical protein